VPGKPAITSSIVPLSCEEVWRHISNFLDDELDANLRARLQQHFKDCEHCSAVLDGTRNVIRLVESGKVIDLPAGFSQRLRAKLAEHVVHERATQKDLMREIPVGVSEDTVPLGSHLIYFWESNAEFERAVRFLHPGLGKGEHCIVFGHDEALEKVKHTLRKQGFDPEQLIGTGELTVLRRHAAASTTLAEISAAMQGALRAGATAVRFLGNLGMGRDPLPAGENDVLELENNVSAMISGFPCVVVCMYDVKALSGRLIMKGGLETHALAICADGVRENPYYGGRELFPHLQHLQ
jgi:anti-sigma factor RsiW